MWMKVDQSKKLYTETASDEIRKPDLLVFPIRAQIWTQEKSLNSMKWVLFRDKGKVCMSATSSKMTLRSIWSDKRLENLLELEHAIEVRAEIIAEDNKLIVKKLLIEDLDIKDETFTQSIIDRISGVSWADIPVACSEEQLRELYNSYVVNLDGLHPRE